MALKSSNPVPKIYQPPPGWTFLPSYGQAYALLVATCAEVEPGFAPPPDHVGKFALRAYTFTPTTTWFSTRYPGDPNGEVDQNQHFLTYDSTFDLQMNARYRITFNAKTDGDISDTRFEFIGTERLPSGETKERVSQHPFGASGTWIKITDSFELDSVAPPRRANRYGGGASNLIVARFSFVWHGPGSLYLDDITIRPEK